MIAALVDGKLTRAEHGKPATCPECAGDLYARLPAHAIRHWAHKPLPDGQNRNCTRNSEGMSEWHRAWQNERTDLTCIEVRGEGFIADIQNTAGHTIEFQHSRIHEDEIKAREQYWRKGCWVADGLPEGHEQIRLERIPGKNYTDDFWLFRWAPMPKLIYLAKWPVWVDVGERGILQVKFAKQGRGGGWLVTRKWFIDEIVNGTKIVLHTHAITRPTASSQNKTRFTARAEKDEDLSNLPVYCPRPSITATLPPSPTLEETRQHAATACNYWTDNGYCGELDTHRYMSGSRCINHTPAAISLTTPKNSLIYDNEPTF